LRRVSVAAAVAAVAMPAAVLASCGSNNREKQNKEAIAKIDREWAHQRRLAEQAVRDRRLPPESLEIYREKGIIQSDFTGGPGSHDVVKQDTNGDGKPDRDLRFDLDQNGRLDSSERRITEDRLYMAVMHITRHSRKGAPPDPRRSS
jgi:hypothetical protein